MERGDSRLQDIITELMLENRKLREAAEARLHFGNAVAEAADSTYSIDEFFQQIFPCILEVMDSSRGSIAMRSQNPLEHENTFYISIHCGIEDMDIEKRVTSFEEAPYIKRALETGNEIIITEKGHSYKSSSIVMPFGWDGVLQGAICVSSKEQDYAQVDSLMLKTCVYNIENQLQHILERLRSKQIYINCVAARDCYTAVHNVVVGQLSRFIAAEFGMSIARQYEIETYAGLHDIGKIAIPDDILLKQEELTCKELEVLKQHPTKGREMLAGTALSSPYGNPILQHHHERYDGRGYPDNLSGEDIPIAARIVSIADAFHAMNSNRPYRERLSASEIIKELMEGEGKQFDPDILPAFIDVLPSLVFTQKRREDISVSFHRPFCEYAQYIPGDEFIVGKRERMEQFKDYVPCPECFAK